MNIKNQEIRQKIADSLNLSHLAKAEQDEVIFVLMDNVSSKLHMAITDKLSEESKKELKSILDKSEEKEALDYINSKVENFPKLVEDITRQTVDDFKEKRLALP